MAGFLAGMVATFTFFFQVSISSLDGSFQFAENITHSAWFVAQPVALTLKPLDDSSLLVDVSTALWKTEYKHFNLGPLGEFNVFCSGAVLHLFVITCFVAFVAPFGSTFAMALKRALKTEVLGQSLYHGGVIDRMECMIVTGLFFLIYVNAVIY